jgi:hypothetical protein
MKKLPSEYEIEIFDRFELLTEGILFNAASVLCYSLHEHKDIIVHVDNMFITKGDSTLFGFGIKRSYKQALTAYFPFRPWEAASEKYLIYPFNTGPTAIGLDTITQFPKINCKEVNVLFPYFPTDTTCFFNPCLENFYVNYNGRNYPNISTSTVSVDFYKVQRSPWILNRV